MRRSRQRARSIDADGPARMELLVVRHAIAFERSPRRWPDDAERPLSPQGAARARKAALGLKRITPRPARVLVSPLRRARQTDRKSTRLNSSHGYISYAVFCLKKNKCTSLIFASLFAIQRTCPKLRRAHLFDFGILPDIVHIIQNYRYTISEVDQRVMQAEVT